MESTMVLTRTEGEEVGDTQHIRKFLMFLLIHNPALFIQTFVRRMISCYMFRTQKKD